MKKDDFNSNDGQDNKIIKFPGKSDEPLGLEIKERPFEEHQPMQGENLNLIASLTPTKKDNQAEIMLHLAEKTASFFHTPDGEAYATINNKGVQKNISLNSEDAELWLTYLLYSTTQNAPSPSSLKNTIRMLTARALFDGPKTKVHIRYAANEKFIYIDLGNDNWEQVEISPEGRRIIPSTDSPVKFRRNKCMGAMDYPAEKGVLKPLREILNLENDSDFKLITGWLLGAMNPKGPFPIIALVGEQGSSKSMTTRILKDLTDPSGSQTLALPKSERDLAIAAHNSWTLPYDNLSKLSDQLSDAFCRLSTGGGFRTRTLYTNKQEMMFDSIRPLIMNGITDFITRQDLADRTIIINLDTIPKYKRIPERQLQEIWHEARPFVFGALCDALSMSLRNSKNIKLPEYPRMADFVHLVTAAEPALGWEYGEFIEVYKENIKMIADIALDADEVAGAVMSMMEKSKNDIWMGKATDLKPILENFVDDSARRSAAWPKQANALSARLKRCATNLRNKGIEIERGKSGDRFISIHKVSEKSVYEDKNNQDE
jgi:hypothetical protein